MEKLNNNLLRMLALAGVLFMYSCGDDEDPIPVGSPTIALTAGDFDDTDTATGVPGDIVTATITVTADGVFNVLRISKSGGEAFDEIEESKASGATDVTFNYSFSYTLVEEEVGETVTFTAQATDDENVTTTFTFTVVTEAPPSPDARVYTVILLEAPLGGTGGGNPTSETFFSSEDGEIYSIEDVDVPEAISKTIDFGYFFGTTNGASLASPSEYTIYDLSASGFNWSVTNTTEFRETALTGEDLLVVTFADIDDAYDNGTEITGPGTITNLAEGDVIAFATDDSKDGGRKRGLILVDTIVDGNGSEGEIILEIHIQEEAN